MLHSSLRRIPDLWTKTYDLVAQVPEGMVTTYGHVARALGDVVASRFVGLAMSRNDDIVRVPCRRVVLSDGRVGGYTAEAGQKAKIDALSAEGVEITGDRIVGFEDILFDDFRTDYPLNRLRRIQADLKADLEIPRRKVRASQVVGVDVAYDKADHAFVAAVTVDLESGREVDTQTAEGKATFPYVPTYLAFRELPVLSPLLSRIREDAILMYDGNGILRPEGFGIASHAGIVFGVPSIGVAKKQLCGSMGDRLGPGVDRVVVRGKTVGCAMNLTPGHRPIFVSPGTGISLPQCVEVVKACTKFRIPEPTRLAHIAADRARRAQSHK